MLALVLPIASPLHHQACPFITRHAGLVKYGQGW
jgi:hypothetical protein